MAPPPGFEQQQVWSCAPNVRPDGCPSGQPNAGTACAHEGQNCDYTCSCSLAAICTSGKWRIENGPCKP